MDFGSLLHIAKKNSESSLENHKYYNTKYAPPKKQLKEKKLSENIKKFLEKREQEEKERQREHREKVAKLLAMRDEASKNKIRRMLKTTKSANKSVLEDAKDIEQIVDQSAQDDYGYVSNEANAFYQRYIEMVKDVKEDKSFAPKRPQAAKDLIGTKERVKAALSREFNDNRSGGSRQRQSKEIPISTSPNTKTESSRSNSSKPLYDPEAEKQEELRKKEEERKQKRKMPPPPPIDFQSLLKLAEKKQFEPIKIEIKKKEPERLLTLKEKREIEERNKAKEAKLHRQTKTNCMPAPNDKKSKPIEHTAKNLSTSNNIKQNSAKLHTNINTCEKTDIQKLNNKNVPSAIAKSNPTNRKPDVKISNNGNKTNGHSSKSADINSFSKQSAISKSREFPPGSKLTKPNALSNMQKTREFPPPDVVRSTLSNNNRNPYANSTKKPNGIAHKKRVIADDDDDDEYDSEMDDFIDDGDENEDYSSHIKAIFGYDRSRYRDMDDDFDDAAMESSFAQVQREEYISKKIGRKEDLEDMKMEIMEKKQKMMKLKRQKLDQ